MSTVPAFRRLVGCPNNSRNKKNRWNRRQSTRSTVTRSLRVDQGYLRRTVGCYLTRFRRRHQRHVRQEHLDSVAGIASLEQQPTYRRKRFPRSTSSDNKQVDWSFPSEDIANFHCDIVARHEDRRFGRAFSAVSRRLPEIEGSASPPSSPLSIEGEIAEIHRRTTKISALASLLLRWRPTAGCCLFNRRSTSSGPIVPRSGPIEAPRQDASIDILNSVIGPILVNCCQRQ